MEKKIIMLFEFLANIFKLNKKYNLKFIFMFSFITLFILVSICFLDYNKLNLLQVEQAGLLLKTTMFLKKFNCVNILFKFFGLDLNPSGQQLCLIVIIFYFSILFLWVLSYYIKLFLIPCLIMLSLNFKWFLNIFELVWKKKT